MTTMTVCAGRAGVPMEVMGLMLGEFVDDYTVKVSYVCAVPRAVGPCFGETSEDIGTAAR